MEGVLVLLVMTVGLSHAIQTSCDARQDGAQCYAPLGGTVGLRLLEKTEMGLEYIWKQNNTLYILKIKRNTLVIPYNEYKNRSSFNVSSGIVQISDITRSDAAQYVLTIADDNTGQLIETKLLHLSVQAPVSGPQLSSECLSQGSMMVSCSCEGDSVLYSWTLDGQTLTDKQLLSGRPDTQDITLPVGTSGYLACDVSNNVSSAVEGKNISTCEGFKLINCTSSNGTQISGWVFDNDTQCVTPTTAPVTPTTAPVTPTTAPVTPTTDRMTPTTDRMTPTTPPTTPPTAPPTEPTTTTSTTTGHSVYLYFQVAELCVLLLVFVGSYIYCRMKTRPPPKQDPCNMVVMETQ